MASIQLMAHKSKTIMVKAIKEAYHSYLSALVFETNRFALDCFPSRRMTKQLRG